MATNPQGLTTEEMGTLAEKQMQDRVVAQSMSNPNTLVTGGNTPAGQFQAMTQTQNPALVEGQAWLAEQAKRAQQEKEAIANRQASLAGLDKTSPYSQPVGTPVPQNSATLTADVGAADARELDTTLGNRQSELEVEKQQRIDALREQQKQEEDYIRQTFSARKSELGSQQQEQQATQDVLSYRLGRKDTPYGVAEMSKLKNDQARVMNELTMEENRLVLQSRAALKKGEFDVAQQLRDEADRMLQRKIQQEELNFRKQSQVMEEQKYAREYGKDVFSALADAGKEPSQELYDWYDETIGVKGIGQSIFSAASAERKRKDIKDAQEGYKADLDAASSLVNVLNKIPVGQEIKIGENTYQGLDRGQVTTGTETDAQGNVTFWEYDQTSGQVKRTALGNIGKPQDGWTTVQTDQGTFSYNTKTKQYVPLQPGVAQSTWQKVFPDGTKSPFRPADDPMNGQCGAWVNDLYGQRIIGDSYEQKASTLKNYEVQREDVQVGDTFLQQMGTTGHIGIVSNVSISPEGKKVLTFLESNAVPPGGRVISTTRTMNADDPRLTMFARVPTPNLPPAGTDSPITSAAVGLTVGGRPIEQVMGDQTGIRNWVDGLKSGQIKISEMPQDIRADVLAQARSEGFTTPTGVQAKPLADFDTFKQAFFQSVGASPDIAAVSPELQMQARQAYEQEKVFRTDLERAIDTVSRRGKSKDQREMIKSDMVELLNTGDYEALDTALRSEAYTQLPAAQQQAFNEFDTAKEASGQASRAADALQGQMLAGPYKRFIEDKKPFVFAKADPRYTQLFQLIELGQAQVARGFYGTAITSTEAAKSKNFLVDPEKDSLETIKQKLENQSKYLEFVNDATIAQQLGLKKPKLSDYIAE